jgi:5-methylthioadenosine/S-adenosylhomocysteine deaminase
LKTKIADGLVFAFDGENHVVFSKGDVVFEDDRIIYAGNSYRGRVDKTIQAFGKLVIPGFINIHTHSLSSPLLYRGILEDAGSMLYKYLLPLRFGTPSRPPFATGEDAYNLSRVTFLELLKSGVTTVFEQTDNLEDVILIGKETGLRLYACHSYFNGMPYEEKGKVVYPVFKDVCPGFDDNIRLLKEYHNSEDGRIQVWLGPHAPDTCSIELLRETRRKASELGVGIGTHVAQSPTEVNAIKERFHKSSVEFLDSIGFWGDDVIAAHAIYTDEADMDIMKKTEMTVAHCASSYVKNAVRSPMAIYRNRGINVVLGTDQNTMDMLEEMRLALFSSKLNERDHMATTCLDVYNAITLKAATALGRSDVGRIAVGAKADIVLLNIKQPHWFPGRDPLKMLLYHGNRNDVDTVIVDGHLLMKERKVLAVDEDEVMAKADEAAKRVWQKADAEVGLPELMLKHVCE